MKTKLKKSKTGNTIYFNKQSGIFKGRNGGTRIWANGVIAPDIEALHKKLSERY